MAEADSSFEKRFSRRPSVPELVGSGLLFLWMLYAASDAAVGLNHLLGISLVGLALVGLWGLHWLAGLWLRAKGRIGGPLTAKEWAAFDEFSRTAIKTDRVPESLGLYRVIGVERERGALWISTCTAGPFDAAGFVRAPYGPPDRGAAWRYRHVRGPWYTFRFSD